jgi:hypothetical protein
MEKYRPKAYATYRLNGQDLPLPVGKTSAVALMK